MTLGHDLYHPRVNFLTGQMTHASKCLFLLNRVKHELQENKAKHCPLWLGQLPLPFTVCLKEYINGSV